MVVLQISYSNFEESISGNSNNAVSLKVVEVLHDYKNAYSLL